MRHQVGDLASTVIPEMAPLVEALRRERSIRCSAEPSLPIQLVERHGRIVAGRRVLIPVRVNERNLPEPPRVDDLFAEDEVIPASLLRAGLNDLFRGFD